MKIARSFSLILLITVNSGCLKPGPTYSQQAQTARLEDTIRFTDLRVSENFVTLKISRIGPRLVTARASGADPSDFPEYATFARTPGGLVSIPSQTQMFLGMTKVSCVGTNCASLTFTLTRPGETVADTVDLKATRISKVHCPIWIREANGSDTYLNPVFESGTLTTTMIGKEKEGDQHSFYSKASYITESRYRASVSIRNFLGSPSELWIDEINYTTPSDGREIPVSTSVRTFNAERLNVSPTSLSLVASDREGRDVQIDCTY